MQISKCKIKRNLIRFSRGVGNIPHLLPIKMAHEWKNANEILGVKYVILCNKIGYIGKNILFLGFWGGFHRRPIEDP